MFKKEVRIGEKWVGDSHPCFIVAEAGVSHFGSIDKAIELVDVAIKAKADAIKFQIFQTDRLISATAADWIERMRPKELSIDAFREIQAYCQQKGIVFFATAHDEDSLKDLAQLNPPAYKIGSGELQNFAFFRQAAALNKPVIFSTGMFSKKDIQDTIRVLADADCKEAIMLHCVTGYPVPNESVNLLAIQTLKNMFSGPVGYSDHSTTHDIAAASVLMGANLIERHLTLEKNIPNAQDWKVSCSPEELQSFIAMTRRLEAAMGDGRLQPQEIELKNIAWARKSIVATEDIMPNEMLTAKKLKMKRPGTGISPAELEKVIGKKARVKIKADTLINWKQLK